ncbi:MAG: hypothetical protein IJM68_00980 [Synergistaceae bacterium]|nr:hypothetical protein [Synergistaceae bacterium]
MKENKLNTETNDEAINTTELTLITLGVIALTAVLLWCSTKLGFMCSFLIWLALCSL